MRLIIFFLIRTVLLFSVLYCGEAVAQEDMPTYWLDYAARQAELIGEEEGDTSAETAYLRATLYYQLALTEVAAGRAEHARARMASVLEIVRSATDDQDRKPAWAFSYLYGPAETVNWNGIPNRPEDVDSELAIHTAVIQAEAFLRTGNVQSFKQTARQVFTQLRNRKPIDGPRVVREDFVVEGMGAAWQLAELARDAGDLETARLLSSPIWEDDGEAIAVIAIHAQMEWLYGDKPIAEYQIEQALKKYDSAKQNEGVRNSANISGIVNHQYGYTTDLDASFTEVMAAIWLTKGRAESMRIARERYGRDLTWVLPAAINAARLVRLTERDHNFGVQTLNSAVQVRLVEGKQPRPADVAKLARELTIQGRQEHLHNIFLKRYPDPVTRGYAALGIAQGMLW